MNNHAINTIMRHYYLNKTESSYSIPEILHLVDALNLRIRCLCAPDAYALPMHMRFRCICTSDVLVLSMSSCSRCPCPRASTCRKLPPLSLNPAFDHLFLLFGDNENSSVVGSLYNFR